MAVGIREPEVDAKMYSGDAECSRRGLCEKGCAFTTPGSRRILK